MQQRLTVGLVTGLVIALILNIVTRMDGVFLTPLLDEYEFRSYDNRMKMHAGRRSMASLDSIVIVDIDQTSILDLGNFKDWPQAYQGKLIDVIESGDPKAIVFDVIFDAENPAAYELVQDLAHLQKPADSTLAKKTDSWLENNDPEWLIRSTASSRRVIHSIVFEAADTTNFLYQMQKEPEMYAYQDHLLELPQEALSRLPRAERIGNTNLALLSAAPAVGSANFPQDSDGVTRRAPSAIHFEGPGHAYPSLALSTAMHILDIPNDGLVYDFDNLTLSLLNSRGETVRRIPMDDQGRININFQGYYQTFYYLPFSYCVDPELLQPEYWKDRIAIVGSSLAGLMDLKNTPVQESFPGVEIQANVLYAILQDDFIRVNSPGLNILVLTFLTMAIGLFTVYFTRPIYSIGIITLAVIGWIGFAYFRFWNQREVWEIVRPIVGMTLTFVSAFLYNYLVTEKDKRFLFSTFKTYISPSLIHKMIEQKQMPQLGGIEGYHSALFSDIQNFSTFSEVLSPTALVDLLNEYLTSQTDVLLAHEGTLDKYIGDAIVAIFGAPLQLEDHEYLACLTALEMQEKLAGLRQKWQAQGETWPQIVKEMRCRIGVNSGNMVTGNMGSSTRMNYTMMGDAVNIAARLESSAKYYGVNIHVGEDTYDRVSEHFEWRFLDSVCLKGKNTPTRVYELLARKGELTERETLMLKSYHRGIVLYEQRSWQEALQHFETAETYEDHYWGRPTTPSKVRIDRCKQFIESPPGDDWDCIWRLS